MFQLWPSPHSTPTAEHQPWPTHTLKRRSALCPVIDPCDVYVEAQAAGHSLCAMHALNHVVGQGLFTSQETSAVILLGPDGDRQVNVQAIAVEEDASRTLEESGNFSSETVKRCLRLVGCSYVPLYPTDFENNFDTLLEMCMAQPSFLGCVVTNNVHWITLRSLGHTQQPGAALCFMDSNGAQTELWPTAEVKRKLVDSFCSYGTNGDCIVIFVCLTDVAQHDWHIQPAGQQ